MNFPSKLKELRKEQNLTQKDLASLASLSPNTISNYETGKTVPHVPEIKKLAIALSVTSDELIGLK